RSPRADSPSATCTARESPWTAVAGRPAASRRPPVFASSIAATLTTACEPIACRPCSWTVYFTLALAAEDTDGRLHVTYQTRLSPGRRSCRCCPGTARGEAPVGRPIPLRRRSRRGDDCR